MYQNGDAAEAVYAAMARLGRAQVLLMVDAEGGSPHRIAQIVCGAIGHNARIVAGLNLPMLLATLPREDVDVDGLAALAAHRARRGVRLCRPACANEKMRATCGHACGGCHTRPALSARAANDFGVNSGCRASQRPPRCGCCRPCCRSGAPPAL